MPTVFIILYTEKKYDATVNDLICFNIKSIMGLGDTNVVGYDSRCLCNSITVP